MVDSIKNRVGLAESRPTPKKAEELNLRDNFKSISSGLSVLQSAQEAKAASPGGASGKTGSQVNRLLDNLNDAVKFSREAVLALDKAVGDHDASSSLEKLTADIEKLRSDIAGVLEGLRTRADAAQVIGENLAAASPEIENVDKASVKAREAGSQIQFRSDQALGAHDGLSANRVAELLED